MLVLFPVCFIIVLHSLQMVCVLSVDNRLDGQNETKHQILLKLGWKYQQIHRR